MKYLALALLSLAVIGCQKSAAPTPEEALHAATTLPHTLQLTRPGTTVPIPPIALYKNEDSVAVGDDSDDAFKVFRGKNPGGFLSERLPPELGPDFKAKVWQGADLGFGVITYDDKIVSAFVEQDDVDQDDLQNIVASYVVHLGADYQMISGERVKYYFWTEPQAKDDPNAGLQRVMIMAYQAKSSLKTVFLTIAMGDGKVLRALGASPDVAEQDKDKVDKALGRRDEQENKRASPILSPPSAQ